MCCSLLTAMTTAAVLGSTSWAATDGAGVAAPLLWSSGGEHQVMGSHSIGGGSMEAAVGRVPWSGWHGGGGASPSSVGRGGRASSCGGPCVCLPEDGRGDALTPGLLVDCSMAPGPDSIYHGFAAAPPLVPPPGAITRLVIMSSELTYMQEDSFANVSFTHIHIKYNHALASLAPDALRSSESSLRVLDLRNNNLTEVVLPLAAFKELQFLSLEANGLREAAAVALMPSLLHLSLANNKLQYMPQHALTGLTQLQFLDLHSNQLQVVPPQIANLHNLRSLLLAGNPITALHSGMLLGLNNLEVLDVSETQVSVPEPGSLSTPTSSPWLINLRSTPLQGLPLEAFRNGVLPAWVDLRNTQVRTLMEEDFRPLLENMEDLNIIHTDWGQPQIWASTGVLSCDCSSKWLATNTTLLSHVSAKCQDKNINMRFLDPDFFNIFCY